MLNKFTANLVSKGSLTKKIKYNFANPLSKRKPLSKDLDHYDLVIIGSNIGGILSTQWDALSHGHFPTMVCFDNPIN